MKVIGGITFLNKKEMDAKRKNKGLSDWVQEGEEEEND